MREPRRLPSLAALRAFEAAAAHMSFKHAAAELSVTPTAISHQVRGLEETLGQALFRRLPRQLTLTSAGANLYRAVQQGLDSIEQGVRALRQAAQPPTVTLTCNTAFAARWLLPRLGALRAHCAGVELRLNATEDVADLARGEADLAVRHGDGRWLGLAVQRLAREDYAPMCSPRLALLRRGELVRQRLVHFDWRPQAKAPALWPRWFRAAGLSAPRKPRQDLTFSEETHAILAVLAGHGVGLLSRVLLAEELASGTLVQPFGPVLATGHYWLAALPERRGDPAIAAVWTWLASQLTDDAAA